MKANLERRISKSESQDRLGETHAVPRFRDARCPIHDSRSAFTLIEVMVVIALMAIVFGLTAVYFAGNLTSSRVAKTARDVSEVIRYGRLLAAESGNAQSVVFNLESRSYGIEGKTAKVLPADIEIRITDQFQGETSRGQHSIQLLPSGGVQGGTIILQKGRSVASVIPDPIVGVIVVKQ